ncbi:hypothetical protein QUB80_22815 [Chlorogloeopsis sp. ULAP01]|uniref:hypothetical protein n=1 Tax=Chlorogloeopsis sp. ULAP01 TaxID=3056483 RepID=UPI0025AB5892|nr:hypothetical protein [Chlorogloeopsis sp. ULAP01]MDM9383523.1 hypothetical protein [Chlorogloeopsis sp. ULAP01]
MKYLQPAIYQSLTTHSSPKESPVAALQQFGSGMKLLARPHSSHRQEDRCGGSLLGVLVQAL